VLKPIIFKLIVQVTQEAEIRKITVQSQPRQKVCETPISINIWAQWYTSVISAIRRSKNKSIANQASLSIKQDPISKTTKAKKPGSMA
jgi:hypothetical protein